jgi:hypothetical protein
MNPQYVIQEFSNNGIYLFIKENGHLGYRSNNELSVEAKDLLSTYKQGLIESLSNHSSNIDNKNTYFFQECKNRLHSSYSFITWFGNQEITKETLSKYWIGLSKNEEIIFPCSETSWYSGVIGEKQTLEQLQFHGQGMCVFGMKAAYKEPRKTVFVTRTLIDCLSVMETGNLAVFADGDHTGELIECLNTNTQIPSYEAYRHYMTVLMVDTDSKSKASQQDLGHKLSHVFISQIPHQYGSLSRILIEDRERLETFLNSHKTDYRSW